MDPVTIGIIGVGAVSGLMQYYQSQKAAKATSKKLKEIEAMFNAIVPPEFDINVWDDPRLAGDIPAPALNVEKITPKMFEQVGQFVPEMAAFVQETNPQLIEATAAAKKGREAQLEALDRYRKIASGEFDPDFAAKMDEASMRSRRDAQTAQDNILQDAAQRGQLGSGLMLQTQMNRTMDAMQRQALESRMAAAESYRNQLGALDSSARLGGDIRQSEMGEQARNAGIINDFNERTSKRFQDHLNSRANVINSARERNISEAQRISDQNTGLENRARLDQVERYNRAQELGYDARVGNRSNAQKVQQQRENLKQQMYENLLAKTRGKAGIGESSINYINKGAQDTNQAIRGVGDGLTAGMLYYGKYGKARAEDSPSSVPSGGGSMNNYSGSRGYPNEEEYEGNYF